jgi:AAA domain
VTDKIGFTWREIDEQYKRGELPETSFQLAKELVERQAFVVASWGDGKKSIATWAAQYWKDVLKRQDRPEYSWEQLAARAYSEFALPCNSWLQDADTFLDTDPPERTAYLKDAETGASVLLQSSNNQIFAARGQGKSVVENALIKLLVNGGEWLRFKSDGGLRVVLMDGELPKQQLHERLHEFTGYSDGRLKIISPELMTQPEEFPVLSTKAGQDRFLEHIAPFAPHVLIFDTLTRCFRFDTNDPDTWLVVNDFLVRLRGLGYCTLTMHHAGKNGTQRGRTDGDDNLDVIVQLGQPHGWEPGQGLAFTWSYEKVRHGGHLPDFEAAYRDEEWVITQDARLDEVLEMDRVGKSTRAIALAMDMSQSAVSRMLRRARRKGLAELNAKANQAESLSR